MCITPRFSGVLALDKTKALTPAACCAAFCFEQAYSISSKTVSKWLSRIDHRGTVGNVFYTSAFMGTYVLAAKVSTT